MSEQSQANDQDQERHQGELVISILLMIGSIWVIYESIVMSVDVYRRVQPDPYTLPGILPFIAAILIFTSSIRVLIYARKNGARLSYFKPERLKAMVTHPDFKVMITILGWMAIYVTILIRILPFEIATFLFILLLLLVYKATSLWKSLLISLIFSVVVTYFFAAVVRTPFPISFF